MYFKFICHCQTTPPSTKYWFMACASHRHLGSTGSSITRSYSEVICGMVMRRPHHGSILPVVHKLEAKFDGLELTHVLRRYSEAADELAKLGSTRDFVPAGVFL